MYSQAAAAGAVDTFLIIPMLNFFRGIPKELEEAALIDGAGHFRTLFNIYLPISLPSIATITLFTGWPWPPCFKERFFGLPLKMKSAPLE